MFYSIYASVLVLILLNFVECDRIDNNLYVEETIEVKLKDDEARFFAIGDWGGPEEEGTFSQVPYRCAMRMKNLRKKPHFVVSTGDNIYPNGVTEDTTSLFQERFQDIFPPLLPKVDWYMVAGNHDWYGDVIEQVKYSSRSTNWKFPALFYSVSYLSKKKKKEKETNPLVELVYIDTVVLCGGTRTANGQKIDGKPMGPDNQNRADHMWAWIQRKLQESSARYLFVVGHYPIFSLSGELKENKVPYGSLACLEQRLLPMLHHYKVTSYISGHEHNLQFMTTSDPSGHTVHHIVSGGGHLMRVKPAIIESSQQRIDWLSRWNFRKLFYYPFTPDGLDAKGSAIEPKGVSKPKEGDSTGGLAFISLTANGGVLQFHETLGLDSAQFNIKPR